MAPKMRDVDALVRILATVPCCLRARASSALRVSSASAAFRAFRLFSLKYVAIASSPLTESPSGVTAVRLAPGPDPAPCPGLHGLHGQHHAHELRLRLVAGEDGDEPRGVRGLRGGRGEGGGGFGT